MPKCDQRWWFRVSTGGWLYFYLQDLNNIFKNNANKKLRY